MSPAEICYEGKYLSFIKKENWEFVERPHAGNCVGILALTDDGKVILVEQFRIPVGKSTIELPAGLFGDEEGFESESLAECANRELEEETGYLSLETQHLMSSPSSPGLSNELFHLFFSKNIKKVSEGGGVSGENIIVHEVAVDKLLEWANKQVAKGKIVDFKIFTCLYLAQVQKLA